MRTLIRASFNGASGVTDINRLRSVMTSHSIKNQGTQSFISLSTSKIVVAIPKYLCVENKCIQNNYFYKDNLQLIAMRKQENNLLIE